MSLIALIADIHANYGALEAVLADAEKQGAESYWCLGDVFGYGPHPGWCLSRLIELRLAGRLPVWVLGNHDTAFLGKPFAALAFRQDALVALDINRKHLEANQEQLTHYEQIIAWCHTDFAQLPEEPQIGRIGQPHPINFVAVHADPRSFTSSYLFPDLEELLLLGLEDSKDLLEKAGISGLPTLIHGHTHHPELVRAIYAGEQFKIVNLFSSPTRFTERSIDIPPEFQDLTDWYDEPLELGQANVINPGSVGQGRDGDWHPRYALLDPDARTVTFRRITYPKLTTLEAMRTPDAFPGKLVELIMTGTVSGK